jgi:hypothetical protein
MPCYRAHWSMTVEGQTVFETSGSVDPESDDFDYGLIWESDKDIVGESDHDITLIEEIACPEPENQ